MAEMIIRTAKIYHASEESEKGLIGVLGVPEVSKRLQEKGLQKSRDSIGLQQSVYVRKEKNTACKIFSY